MPAPSSWVSRSGEKAPAFSASIAALRGGTAPATMVQNFRAPGNRNRTRRASAFAELALAPQTFRIYGFPRVGA